MIRLFTALCKTILNILPDETLFLEAMVGFNYYHKKCPLCGAVGKLVPYGDYSRVLISLIKGKPVDSRILPNRFKCKSCGATHALLPDVLVPYSPYTLRFKLCVLIAYFERKTTIVNICESFDIAVSTLYRWKDIIIEHKGLLLGVLINSKTPALEFLRGLLNSHGLSDILRSFFWKYGFSFMQGAHLAAARSNPP